jgi:hypothetical protein
MPAHQRHFEHGLARRVNSQQTGYLASFRAQPFDCLANINQRRFDSSHKSRPSLSQRNAPRRPGEQRDHVLIRIGTLDDSASKKRKGLRRRGLVSAHVSRAGNA